MRSIIVRLLVYGALTAAVIVPLWLDSSEQVDFITAHKVGEHTWTEFFHILLAALIALVFYRNSRQDSEVRVFCRVVSIFFVAVVFREWEDYLHYFHEALKTVSDIVVPVLLLYLCWYVFRAWKEFVAGAVVLFRTIASGYFVVGLVIVFVFSRLYGMQDLWKALLEGHYTRTVKNASEETLETLGFALILAAAVEFGRHLKNSTKT